MRLLFIRHGKTKGNLESRYVGKTDESLCQEGIDELEEMVSKQKFPNGDIIYTSPLKRCVQTAEIIYKGKEYISCSSFRECDFGSFEYKNYKELSGDSDYQKWIDSNGTMDFPKGEGVLAFKSRCQKEYETIPFNEKHALISFVVHGGTIMSIFEKYAMPHKEYYDWQIKNGEGYLCELLEDKRSFKVLEKISLK